MLPPKIVEMVSSHLCSAGDGLMTNLFSHVLCFSLRGIMCNVGTYMPINKSCLQVSFALVGSVFFDNLIYPLSNACLDKITRSSVYSLM